MRDAAASRAGAGALEGRGTVHVVPAPVGPGRWVVRPYRRGGAVASWLGDRYLRLGTPRPVREFGVGRAVEELGIPTPAHIGAAVYPRGLWYRGDLVTELVPDSRDLAAALFGGPAPAGGEGVANPGVVGAAADVDPDLAMAAAGSLVRLLHDRGVIHRDLNLKNILITGPDRATGDPLPDALILDLDRATVGAPVRERARRRMLDRFWRSARKWESRTGQRLDPSLRGSFERGYGQPARGR